MKTKISLILLMSAVMLAAACNSTAQEKKTYSQTAAHDAVEAACKEAATDGKDVFIKSGYPECGWCRIFDRYHSTPEVQKIIRKYYVVVAIDTENMPDGKSVFSQYAPPGAPSWVIITPQKKVVVDSYSLGLGDNGSDGNVGYPAKPNETAYYLAALKKATPAITSDELHTLSEQIQKAMKK